MRAWVTTICELVGVCLVVAGVWLLLGVPAALLVGGLLLVAVGVVQSEAL